MPLSKELFYTLMSGRAPEGLVVGSDLDLSGTLIRSLPPGLHVQGSLDLRGCPRFHRLGPGTIVTGDLLIGGPRPREAPADLIERASAERSVPLRQLPEALSVGGKLEIRNAALLEELPSDLRVGRDLLLSGCAALRTLPATLTIHGGLTINGGPLLEELPATLQVDGDLRIFGTAIRALPETLTVGGSLFLVGCSRLTALHDPIVWDDLEVHHWRMKEWPALSRVRGDIRLLRSRWLERLPEGFVVNGSLAIRSMPKLTTLGDGLTVASQLNLLGCPALTALPSGLSARSLDLRGSAGITKLPPGLRLQRLNVANCSSLTELPADLKVEEPPEIGGSAIQRWPGVGPMANVRWRGVTIQAHRIFDCASLPPTEILQERNAELRRVLVDRVGADALLERCAAKILDADTDPGGARRLVEVTFPPTDSPRWGWGREAPRTARYLHCRCPSTGRQYLLGVPGQVDRCHAAAAWLAGFDSNPQRYNPVVET